MQFKKKKSFINNKPYLKKVVTTVSPISSSPALSPISSSTSTASSTINNNKKYIADTIMTTTTTTTTTTALADSISVASSTATPRIMNTTKLSMRASSGGSNNNKNDTGNIFTTALTVRNANAAAYNNKKKTGTTTQSSPQTKRARTTADDDNEENNGTSSGSDIIPIERRPLPSARELSKVLCRIIDDETYTENDSEIALETLHIWSLKQNVAFGNHFADVGGLQQVLFFVEDHIDDPKCIVPAFWLMETLCKPLQGASATIYESKALSNMRIKIGKCIVDIGGVHLMLRTFQYHALPSHTSTSTNTNTNTTKGNNKKKNSSTKRSTSLSSSSFGVVGSTTTTTPDDDDDDDDVESGMWKAFKHMLKTNHTIADDVFMNPCSAAFTSGDPTMLCMSSNNNQGSSIITDIDNDNDNMNHISYQKIDTSRHSMEVLALLIPHVIGVDKTAPGKILTTLCDAIPILIEELMKVKVTGGRNNFTKSTTTSNTTSSSTSSSKDGVSAFTNNKPEKVYESLIASVLKCLVSTTAVASKETFTNNSTSKGKQIVSVTNNIMRSFPNHHGMNRDGCFVLQKVCKHLSKIERKRLGVVASLGNVVASDSIDQDVKDIADEILEEQFR
jgi:hypothetical protein